MAVTTAVLLNGDDLRVEDVWAVAIDGVPAGLSEDGRGRMRAARELVEKAASGAAGEHTYGINTGFGRFVEKTIPPELSEELQLRLLRSHACGVGDAYPDEVVRAAMLLRANTLAKGYSGARIETVELFQSSPAAARSEPPGISHRSPISRFPSSGRAGRPSTGTRSREPKPCPLPASSRCAFRRRKAYRS
jgi:hypothetical protein